MDLVIIKVKKKEKIVENNGEIVMSNENTPLTADSAFWLEMSVLKAILQELKILNESISCKRE